MPRLMLVTGYVLTPQGAAALAESRLTATSDAYDVVGAFEKAQAAAPGDHTILRRYTEEYPQHKAELINYAYARAALGWTLTDRIEAEFLALAA